MKAKMCVMDEVVEGCLRFFFRSRFIEKNKIFYVIEIQYLSSSGEYNLVGIALLNFSKREYFIDMPCVDFKDEKGERELIKELIELTISLEKTFSIVNFEDEETER